MMDLLEKAIQYGGFTNLDRVYLAQVLSRLTPEQQLLFITPPPSVINAYFAEIYQKQTPKAATDYYFNLSKELQLFQTQPSFTEEKPFVRLNLSGKSFGFAYVDESGLATVFPEQARPINSDLLFEIAQIFPQYVIFEEKNMIFMKELDLPEKDWQSVQQDDFLLTEIEETSHWVKISGLNQEEVCQAANRYRGKVYYAYQERSAVLFIKISEQTT